MISIIMIEARRAFDRFPQNAQAFSIELFQKPSKEYRGAPLWSWNNKLDKEQLYRQIQYLKDMGLGGFFMHVRIGLATEYRGEVFMDIVKGCVEQAKAIGMFAYFYDEDRWPSGAAGGLVTEEKEFRAKHLLFTPYAYGDPRATREDTVDSSAKPSRTENGTLLAAYDVELDAVGFLASYRLMSPEQVTNPQDVRGRIWYAYEESVGESPWSNDQTYVDTLNKNAIERFVELTHEKYYGVVGKEFGGAVPAIFTDEPQFTRKMIFTRAKDVKDAFMPWTADLLETIQKQYDLHLLDYLPELFWDTASIARYSFTTMFARGL